MHVAVSIHQRIRRTFAEPVAAADVGEGRARIGVSREVLQIDDVRSTFAARGEGRHPE